MCKAVKGRIDRPFLNLSHNYHEPNFSETLAEMVVHGKIHSTTMHHPASSQSALLKADAFICNEIQESFLARVLKGTLAYIYLRL